MSIFDRLSIRVRITLGSVLLALAFFVIAALIVHALVARLLTDSTVTLLDADIAPFAAAIDNEPDDSVDQPADGQLIAVVDPAGAQLVSTLPDSLLLAMGDVSAMPATTLPVELGDSRYLVKVEHKQSAQGEWTIVAARDQSAVDIVISGLTAGVWVGLAVLVIAFGLVSWLLTGSALRPVSRLRRSAEQIVASGSDDLLPVTHARDEITALADTLNRLIEDLRASAARERQMVSDASHELRTPLAVLQTQLELLRTGDRAKIDDDIVSAERAASRLNHLVSDLLELSRLEATTPHGRPQTSTVAELLEEAGQAVDRARLAASASEIDIEMSVAAPAPAWPFAAIRPTTFGRLVDNLLSNAVSALSGAGHIDVTLDFDASSVILSVADDGPGMDPAFLPHAFERFSRPDDARGGKSGAGLGLAIVAAAVSAAGGSASLRNRRSGGLEVMVCLPLREHPETL